MNSWRNVFFGKCVPSFLVTASPNDDLPKQFGSLDIVVQMKDIAGNACALPDGLTVAVNDTDIKNQVNELVKSDDQEGIYHISKLSSIETTVVLVDQQHRQVMNGDDYDIQYFVDGDQQDDDYARLRCTNRKDHHVITIVCQILPVTQLELYVVKRDECHEAMDLLADELFLVHVSDEENDQIYQLDQSNDYHVVICDICIGKVKVWMEEMPGFINTYQCNQGEEGCCLEMVICAHEHHEVACIASKQAASILSISKLIREQDGTLLAPQKKTYQVHVLGSQMDQIIMLNESNRYTVDIFDMCPGMYTIYEEGSGNYDVSYIVDGQRECAYAQVAVGMGESHDIMIINAYPQFDDCSSRLRICKYIKDACGQLCRPNDDESFKVMLSGCGRQEIFNLNESNNWCVDIDTICNGYYEINEIDSCDYMVGYIVNQEAETTSACVQICEDFPNCVKIVNTKRSVGKVTIRKYLRNECGELVKPKGNYVFYATLKSYFMKECFVLNEANDWCVTFDHLREGSYEVKEQVLDDMDTWYMVNGCPSKRLARFIVDGYHEQVVKIINEERPCLIGTLSISKYIETQSGTLVKPSNKDAYEVRVEGGDQCLDITLDAHNRFQVCIEDLQCKTYCVHELLNDCVRYLLDGVEVSSGCVEMDAYDHEITIINTEEHIGNLTICVGIEDCDGCIQKPDEHESFTVLLEGRKFSQEYCLSCENNWCIRFDQLPKGRFRIYQKDDYGYLVSYEINGKRKARASISLYEQDESVLIVNQMRRCSGSVCIEKKECIDDHLCTPQDACFELELTGRRFQECFTLSEDNHYMMNFNMLEEGKYTLKEIKGQGRILVNGCKSDGTFILGKDNLMIQVINDVIPCPKVFIEKQLRNECGEIVCPSEEDCFEILLEGKQCREYYTLDHHNDWKLCFTHLEAGVYHIFEKECGYEVSFIVNGECRNDGSFVIGKHDVTILLVNEMIPQGSVEISKWISDENNVFTRPHRDECFEIKVEGEAYCQVFDLNYNNHWCIYLDHLRPGKYEIKEAFNPEYEARFEINGKEMLRGIFFVDIEDVEVKLINQDRCVGGLTLCGYVDEDGNACTPSLDDRFSIMVVGEGFEECYTLDCHNDWCVCLDALYSGEYLIQNQDESLCMEVISDNHTLMGGKVCVDQEQVEAMLVFKHGGHDVFIQKCMVEDDCMFEPSSDQKIRVQVTGKGLDEILQLTHKNHFEAVLHHVLDGCYEIRELDHEGYQVHYEINGYKQEDGHFMVQGEDVGISIMNEEIGRGGTIHITAKVKDHHQKLVKPETDMSFQVEVEGVGFLESKTLDKENDWTTNLKYLKPGRISVIQALPDGVKKIRYQINGGNEQRHAILSLGDEDQSVTIVNIMDDSKGSLIIRKYVADEGCGCMHKPCGDESFDILVKGNKQEYKYVLDQENRFMVTIEDLEHGDYEVVELGNHQVGYMVDGEEETTRGLVHIEHDHHLVNVVNHPSCEKRGSIEINKWVRSEMGQFVKPAGSMAYQVVLQGPKLAKTFMLSASNDWQVTVDNLLEGTYQVIEKNTMDHQVMYLVDQQLESEEAVVYVSGSDHQVSIINEVVNEKGSITLQKFVRNVNHQISSPSEDARYRVHISKAGYNRTITLDKNNHFAMTLSNLSDGNYTIEELGDYRATYVIDGGNEVNFAVVKVEHSNHQVDIINQADINSGGAIEISKYVRNEQGEFESPKESETFRVLVSKAGYQTTEELNFENNWRITLRDLEAGNYTVHELDQKGVTYIVDDGSEVDQGIVSLDGDFHTVRIINTMKKEDVGSMRICKYIRGMNGQLVKPTGDDRYLVRITSAGFNETITLQKDNDWCVYFKDLANGNYTISEVDNPNKVTYMIDEGSEVDYATVVINNNQSVIKMINYPGVATGSITLRKRIKNSTGQESAPAKEDEFSISLMAKDFYQIYTLNQDNRFMETITDLPQGIYTVQEADESQDYQITYRINGQAPQETGQVMINNNANLVDIINEETNAINTLEFMKFVVSNTGVLEKPKKDEVFEVIIKGPTFQETITLNAENNWYHDAFNLPNGNYTLQEVRDPRYTTAYIVNGEDQSKDASFVMADGVNNFVEILNTPKMMDEVPTQNVWHSSDDHTISIVIE